MDVSKRIIGVLKAMGFTNKSLSLAMGISQDAAGKLLNGDKAILVCDFYKIVEIMRGATPNLLVNGADAVYLPKEGVR